MYIWIKRLFYLNIDTITTILLAKSAKSSWSTNDNIWSNSSANLDFLVSFLTGSTGSLGLYTLPRTSFLYGI